MGKLKELREQWEQMSWDDPDRTKVEEEINRIEQYCIDNGFANITKLTVWGKGSMANNPLYPWHTGYFNLKDIQMLGDFNEKRLHYNSDKSIHHCQMCAKI